MPTPTPPPSPTPRPTAPSSADRGAGTVALAAAALAFGELACGLSFGRFLAAGRIDPSPFLEARPWLLLVAALLLAGQQWRRRLACYALALAAASAAEAVLLGALGGPVPWGPLLRGLAAGAAAAALADAAVQAGRRRGRFGTAAAAVAVAGLLLAAALIRPFDRAAPAPVAAAGRPALLIMTALPIVWGEKGAFDPEARPAEAYRLLQAEFDVRPIDALDEASLAGARLLLLAQPRWLEPAELVALDAWVRGGGRALILTDPALVWPSELPLGDIRRPPPVGLLKPLLDHWGLRLAAMEAAGPAEARLAGRKLAMDSPGRFEASGRQCRVEAAPWLAYCAPGSGRAYLLADADLLRDELWLAGGGRERRNADNPLVAADLLDRLAGVERARTREPIAWIAPGADPGAALGFALAPILAPALFGLAALLRRRRGRE